MSLLNLVLNLDRDFTTVQDITTEIHHYLRTPASIIASSSYLLQIALTGDKKVAKSPLEYAILIQDAAQCLEANCYRVIEKINQAPSNSLAINRIRLYLDKMLCFCQIILDNVETISHSQGYYEISFVAEKSELINLVEGLNQWAMQMTDVLSSERFNDYVQQFAQGLLMQSCYNSFGEYQSA
ncbi:hypothetical protein PL8927_220089 [Planktothrix serta PCC 8927]|uniref:Uncharacterized protein n=1 Tax=Planktothrix serta PCC 8927 TaxID=671068 RepID=A0A7Z9BJL9_9CYAN|nr:hypothetical protein [Planktothrix serta]VXD13203.1 hypothetical protein PL8927_220089 [Planktothrix serta PCC 8927]